MFGNENVKTDLDIPNQLIKDALEECSPSQFINLIRVYVHTKGIKDRIVDIFDFYGQFDECFFKIFEDLEFLVEKGFLYEVELQISPNSKEVKIFNGIGRKYL